MPQTAPLADGEQLPDALLQTAERLLGEMRKLLAAASGLPSERGFVLITQAKIHTMSTAITEADEKRLLVAINDVDAYLRRHGGQKAFSELRILRDRAERSGGRGEPTDPARPQWDAPVFGDRDPLCLGDDGL